ncbi:unnamed protein product [Somion occarium]|uniref:Protein kinase domain-containing protein n=1 Tax=Somion occarium TaxID=3059160 RepID=A0ABP1DRM2_9APHY
MYQANGLKIHKSAHINVGAADRLQLFSTSSAMLWKSTSPLQSHVKIAADGGVDYEFDPADVKTVETMKFSEESIGLHTPIGPGFRRVNIGDSFDILDTKFKICRKLGWGTHSSVWLVKDESDYYVVEVLTEYFSKATWNGQRSYFDILERIHKECSKETNKHPAAMFQRVGPDVNIKRSFPYRSLKPDVGKVLCRQILQALDMLHRDCEVVHMDIKPASILVQSPLSTQEISDLLLKDPPMTYPGSAWTFISREEIQRRLQHTEDDSSVLRQVSEPVSQPLPAPPLDRPDSLTFKLSDFGDAQFLSQQTFVGRISPWVRSPEMVLDLPWNEKTDIWAFGCTLFQLLTATDLISRIPASEMAQFDAMYLQAMARSLSTTFPSEMLEDTGREDLKHITAFRDLRKPPPESRLASDIWFRLALAGITGKELEAISSFLRRCLTLNPNERPSAKELLDDRWLQ